MTKKLTYEFIKKSFEKENYILLSKEYINNHTKLYYKCSKGHVHNIRRINWKNGNRCPTCAGNARPTIKYIRESFEREGYILLSKEYITCDTKLHYICSKGHNHSMTWSNWNKKRRCPTCDDIKRSIINSGVGNRNWLGGISYEPYCPIWSDKEYKEDIKLRDGYKCLNPICSKKDSRLHIHHIDYNKKNCEYKNVITLCGSCNAKANFDREWHTAWYQALMYMRYNYKY